MEEEIAAWLRAQAEADIARAGRAAGVFMDDPRTEAARAESVRAVLDEYEGTDGFDLEAGVSEGRDYDERERDDAVKDALGHVVRLLACGYRHREGLGMRPVSPPVPEAPRPAPRPWPPSPSSRAWRTRHPPCA